MNGQRYPYYMMPRQQGQGFYNPYMRGPDWGQGVQMLMQNLMQVRQLAEEKRRRDLQMQMQQERLGFEKERLQLSKDANQRAIEAANRQAKIFEFKIREYERDWNLTRETDEFLARLKQEDPQIYAELRFKYIPQKVKEERAAGMAGAKAEAIAKVDKQYREPTTYEQLGIDIEKAHKSGQLSDEEYAVAVKNRLGIPVTGNLTTGQALNARVKVNDYVNGVIDDYVNQKYRGKQQKFNRLNPSKEDIQVLQQAGLDLRFPNEFHYAAKRVELGISNPGDIELLQAYMNAYDDFIRNYLGQKDKNTAYQAFIGAHPQMIDPAWIRRWFDRQKEWFKFEREGKW